MSYYLRVLCKSGEAIGMEEVEEFIEEGVYFEEEPVFERVGAEGDGDEWGLEVRYDPGKRPVIVRRWRKTGRVQFVPQRFGRLW